jgi:tRNA A-37 threonylcarbamoyl transferase component Bud32
VLSVGDADLARRDPAIPGLRALLDPDEFAHRLRRASGRHDLEAARATYIKYQPGLNCLVGYQMKLGQISVPVHATAYRADAALKLDKARREPGISGHLGPGHIALHDCGAVASIFPNDRKVKAIRLLCSDQTCKNLLGELLPAQPKTWDCAVRPIAYKPQLRYVACLHDGKEAFAVVKCYREKDYAAAKRNAQALTPSRDLRLPRLISFSDSAALLALEWSVGRSLSEVIGGLSVEKDVLEEVGAALASLHRQEPAGVPALDRKAEAVGLAKVADALSALCPHLGRRARTVARKLGTRLVDLPRQERPLHGDFYTTQVLVSQAGVVILDLDLMVRGDPAADLGNFIAYLILENLRGVLSASRVADLSDSLISGYRRSAPLVRPDRIGLYTAVGLLKRGLKPFRYRQSDWPEQTEALLERLEQLLTRAGARERARATVAPPHETGET